MHRKLAPVIFIAGSGLIQSTIGYFVGRAIAGDGPFAGLAAGIVAICCLWLGLFVGVAFARSIWKPIESTRAAKLDAVDNHEGHSQVD
jgi:hypothetical protein